MTGEAHTTTKPKYAPVAGHILFKPDRKSDTIDIGGTTIHIPFGIYAGDRINAQQFRDRPITGTVIESASPLCQKGDRIIFQNNVVADDTSDKDEHVLDKADDTYFITAVNLRARINDDGTLTYIGPYRDSFMAILDEQREERRLSMENGQVSSQLIQIRENTHGIAVQDFMEIKAGDTILVNQTQAVRWEFTLTHGDRTGRASPVKYSEVIARKVGDDYVLVGNKLRVRIATIERIGNILIPEEMKSIRERGMSRDGRPLKMTWGHVVDRGPDCGIPIGTKVLFNDIMAERFMDDAIVREDEDHIWAMEGGGNEAQ